MSLNTAHANGGVLIFSGECILLFCDGVEVAFDGGKEACLKGAKKGRLYLTTHRMVFTNKDAKDTMQSFSFPFFSMRAIELEQPLLGANYIKAIVRAQLGGNWIGEAKFKIHFMNGGAIEYGQAMLQAAKMASRNMPSEPPAYTPPAGPYYSAAPEAYAPPPSGYGWVPQTSAFGTAPPANTVYMTQDPPPYPGIYNTPSNPPPYMQQYNGTAAAAPVPQQMTSSEMKAREAEQSAYVDPNNPNTAYIPPPAYYQPPPNYDQEPPPYSEASKKTN
ncbi:WW domain-binding protein 2 [Nymphon striatum]|nr:WW domain-binding protein 2 [Nymphon striatum]